ncbi:MAG: Gfo/Idh/MocA family oxidoreductase [Candidatus Sumerlaeota bacterium]|nr:Gfo/Idh/MocA family oxidoreductase [Candidatus Sumerlaeota bacterium]
MKAITDRNEISPALSRRKLTAAAAAVGSAFSIVKPAQVRGAAANSKIEIGIVGLGERGRWIAHLFDDHGGFKVVAVADYFPQVADEIGDILGVARTRRFSGLMGYRRLIESKVDAVILQTPPYAFPEHAAAAVNAGCHVYMAKPIACDTVGCLSIAESGRKAAEQKLVFFVDFQILASPLWQEAVRRIRAGELGKIPFICSYYFDEGAADPPKTKNLESRLRGLVWVNDEELGGGYLLAAGVHALNAAQWLANYEAPLFAIGCSRRSRKNPNGDSHDIFSATYQFAAGLIHNHRGKYIQDASGDDYCGLTAFGQGAVMEGRYNGRTWIYQKSHGGWQGGEHTSLYSDGAKSNIALFHKNILEGACHNPTVLAGVNSTLTGILGREAGKINGKLTWDEMIKANKKIEPDLTGLTQ